MNKSIENILKMNSLSLEILELLSYKTKLGSSLKKEMGQYDKEQLIKELIEMTIFYDESETLKGLGIDYRIKSLDSILLKYNRYIDKNMETRKVYNDILGFRVLCDNYEELFIDDEKIRVVDMTKGKANDDGYRGVHLYYQYNNEYYPIELQFNTFYDRQINNWLHDYVYKKNYSNDVGKELRKLYESGIIKNINDFEKELKKCVI